MNLFITGANSFIGRSVISACDDLGISWSGIDIVNKFNNKINICDVRDPHLYKYIKKNDCILHLAAIASDSAAQRNLNECYDINISGALNVFNCAKKSGAVKYIFASTEWVYGDMCSELVTEVVKPSLHDLKSPYAITKLITEYILNSRTGEDIDIVTLRFGILYGKRKENLSAFESIILDCLNNSKVTIGSKNTSRRFIDVNNLSKFIVKNYINLNPGVYNISSKNLISLYQIIKECELLLNKKIEIEERSPNSQTIRNVFTRFDYLTDIDSEPISHKVNKLINYYKNEK